MQTLVGPKRETKNIHDSNVVLGDFEGRKATTTLSHYQTIAVDSDARRHRTNLETDRKIRGHNFTLGNEVLEKYKTSDAYGQGVSAVSKSP